MTRAEVTIRRRRTSVLYGVVAAVLTALAASALDLAVPLGMGLALGATAVTARVAPPRRAWIADDSVVVEGWRARHVVQLSEIDVLGIAGVNVHPPTLEMVYARNKAIGPIFLEQSSRPFVAEFVAAMETSGRADDRSIRDNLSWLRRYLAH
ncbi:hypothetical protein ACFQU3_19715 [Terrabacter sp. GCM10028922]|uniref:hypothetical protein n=1 Tax=Terrabacter sp. GCM10028922 TaxID=3273428 RepID=UPI00360CE9CE